MPNETVRWKILFFSLGLCYLFFYILPSLRFIDTPVIIENRVKSSFPDIPTSLESASGYARKLNDYLTDHFPARIYMISWINDLRYKIGYSTTPKVFVGDAGWLFYDDGSHLPQLRQTSLPTENVKLAASALSVHYLNYKKANIEFVFISAPTKEIVYPEYLPSWLKTEKYFPNSVLMRQEILHNSDPGFFPDLISAMQQLKLSTPSAQLYSKFDTHWTDKGALLAYLLILDRWRSIDNTARSRLSLSDTLVGLNDNFPPPKNLAYMLGIAGYKDAQHAQIAEVQNFQPKSVRYLTKSETWDADRVISTGNSGPTLLLVGDSFSTNLIPLLARNFETIIFAHHQKGFFREDLVKEYQPSFVLLEVIESGAIYVR